MRIVQTSWIPAPAEPPEDTLIAAIGDVHGMADHLDALLAALTPILAEHAGPVELIQLGDLIDRGPAPIRALDRMITATQNSGVRARTLRGNHEDWLLAALDPETSPWDVRAWILEGGQSTLLELGLPEGPWPDNIHRTLPDALGPARLRFLRETRLSIRLGGYLFVHAGIDPGRPLDDQRDRDLLWIRRRFLDAPPDLARVPGVVTVHGHTPGRTQIRPHRIGVDSGAPATGILSAVLLSGDRLRFVSAVAEDADPRALPPAS